MVQCTQTERHSHQDPWNHPIRTIYRAHNGFMVHKRPVITTGRCVCVTWLLFTSGGLGSLVCSHVLTFWLQNSTGHCGDEALGLVDRDRHTVFTHTRLFCFLNVAIYMPLCVGTNTNMSELNINIKNTQEANPLRD